MRKIKFRAFYKKYWIYVTLKSLCDCVGISEWAAEGTAEDLFGLGKYKTQFTGLKDKNGKEIYEGDVIKHSPYMEIDEEGSKEDTVIIKIEDLFEFLKQVGLGELEFSYDYEPKHLEIIGNIYENKELLK